MYVYYMMLINFEKCVKLRISDNVVAGRMKYSFSKLDLTNTAFLHEYDKIPTKIQIEGCQ